MDDGVNICFNRTNMYLFLLGFSICFLLYIHFGSVWPQKQSDMLGLKQELMDEIEKVRSEGTKIATRDKNSYFLNKIYNPLTSPSPLYPGGSFSTPPFDGYRQFQQLGYLTGPNGQFPVMGRYKYSGKTDKYEYQCLNEGRNRVKIQFKNKNDNELYDGDHIDIPELGGDLIFKKYEDTDSNRYDPTVI